MRTILSSLLFLFSLVAVCNSQTEQEDPVATASPKMEMSSRDVVRSLHHMAWVEKQGNLRIVRLDGKQQGGHYNEVAFLQFSPDESHLVFATRSDIEWWLVLDGKDQPEHYSLIQSMQWQPGSSQLVYTACREKKKCQLYVDGKATGPEYEWVGSLKYSQDGKHMAYPVRHNNSVHTVVDGKEIGPGMDHFDGKHWGFSRTGRFYVAACRGYKTQGYNYYINNEHWKYVVDGKEGPEFEVISPIEFSRDGQHYAYAGTTVKHGWKQKPVSSIMVDGAMLRSYDGQKFFGGAHINTGVHDYHPYFHGLSNPFYEPGGKLVYAARREKDVAVFVGDEAGQGFTDIVSPIIFSPDAQHFAYIAQQGGNLVEVHDNHPGATFSIPGPRRMCYVDWIYVTNEPRHHLVYELVCGATQFVQGHTTRALRQIVVDGKAGPEYDAYGLYGFRYTPDWKHYGYEVHGMNGNHVLLNIDGKETKVYDDVVSGSLDFPVGSETASFIAREGETLVRVKWPIQGKSPEAQ
jgi:hypothetical protein